MAKIKPSKRTYLFQANVYNERFGPELGKTANIGVVANNEKDAYEQAKISFNKYINALYKHHNIDSDGQIEKVINTFYYNNLKLV